LWAITAAAGKGRCHGEVAASSVKSGVGCTIAAMSATAVGRIEDVSRRGP